MEKYLMLGVALVSDFFIACAVVVIVSCVSAILHGMYTGFKNRITAPRVLRRAVEPTSQELENDQN